MIKAALIIIALLVGNHFYIDKADSEGKSKLYGVAPIYVVNASSSEINLYSARSVNRRVSVLHPGKAFLFQYQGATGLWWYGIDRGKEVVDKSDTKRKSIRIFDRYILIHGLWVLLLVTIFVAGGSFLTASYLFAKYKSNKHLQGEKEREFVRIKGYSIALQKENNDLKIMLQEMQRKVAYFENKASTFERQAKDGIRRKERERREQEEEHNRQEAYLRAEHDRNTKRMYKEFQRSVQKLNEQIKKESETRYNVKVEQIQASYDQLNNGYLALEKEYKKLVRDGLDFDIGFNKEGYQGVLKGRQFELFFARQMVQNPLVEILEWTSDKGVENNIKVKSNGNPDFVFVHKTGYMFAVECKYRNVAFEKDNVKRISWATTWQAKRYIKFSNDRSIPVFIAMGRGPLATNPESVRFLDIHQLISKSDEVEVTLKDGKVSSQFMIPERQLSEYSINKKYFVPEVMGVIGIGETC